MRFPAVPPLLHRLCVHAFAALAFALACLAAPSAKAAGCDPSLIPSSGAGNAWYCANASDTVFVFVHGLHSDSLTAWKTVDRPGEMGAYWPGLVTADPALKSPSVYLANFYTEMVGTDYSMADAAAELYRILATPTGGQPPVLTKRNIVFVAHSLGGIVTRQVLVQYADKFADKRVGLLLVASPSYGSSYATMLGTAASVTRNRLVQELSVASPFLQLLDRNFKKLRDDNKIPGLVGAELIENQFVDLGASDTGMFAALKSQFGWTLAKVYGTRVVEPDSAARYFSDAVTIPKSDHFTIARPTGLNDHSHRELVLLYNRMQTLAAPACRTPQDFKLTLDVGGGDVAGASLAEMSDEFKATLPLLKFWRTNPDGTLDDVTDQAYRDPLTSRHSFAPRPPFPCPGETFRAKFRAVPLSSYRGTGIPLLSDLCFRRSAAKANERFAFLRCSEQAGCRPDPQAPGLAEPCGRHGGLRWPSLIGSAHAQDASAGAQHWVAPALTTLIALPAGARPGYAEFTVRSAPLQGVAGATHLSYGLTVNGVPIYFDGIPPHTELQPFNSADGVRLVFGIENLGFTGGEDGNERIDLELRFWKGTQVLKAVRLARDYVSYRHAPSLKIADPATGEVYTWAGYYRPAQIQNRYEVMLAVGANAKAMQPIRADLDKRRKAYSGSPVVGVIRPGRVDNPVYGMTVGLRQPTGQVKSSFTESEAKAICRWVVKQSGLPQWMRSNSYLYEFPSETITDNNDRGRQRAHCRSV